MLFQIDLNGFCQTDQLRGLSFQLFSKAHCFLRRLGRSTSIDWLIGSGYTKAICQWPQTAIKAHS
ncbi:hypothetical protein D3C75_1316880 [compost metagenome]